MLMRKNKVCKVIKGMASSGDCYWWMFQGKN